MEDWILNGTHAEDVREALGSSNLDSDGHDPDGFWIMGTIKQLVGFMVKLAVLDNDLATDLTRYAQDYDTDLRDVSKIKFMHVFLPTDECAECGAEIVILDQNQPSSCPVCGGDE